MSLLPPTFNPCVGLKDPELAEDPELASSGTSSFPAGFAGVLRFGGARGGLAPFASLFCHVVCALRAIPSCFSSRFSWRPFSYLMRQRQGGPSATPRTSPSNASP